MRYYVKHEDGEIWGPMSRDEAEAMRDHLKKERGWSAVIPEMDQSFDL